MSRTQATFADDDPRHGSLAGFFAHTRRKEVACGPCAEARAADSRQRSRARSETKYVESGYDPNDGLGEGEWVLDRRTLVLKWVEAPRRPMPAIREVDVTKLIACPTCHARVDQSCRTRNGNLAEAHKSRLTPRLCPCGASLDWRRRRCDTCAPAAIKESKLASAKRIREARRKMRTKEAA